jgi:hypothetical protein
MAFRSFQRNYHDGQLACFTVGPRRELTLEIALDPVWNKHAPPSASVRFGAIENYHEVAAFFRALPPPRPNGYIAEIIGLQYVEDGPNWIVVDLQDHGAVKVRSRHVTES